MNRAELIQNNLKMIESNDEEILNLFMKKFYPTKFNIKLEFIIDKQHTGEFDPNTKYEFMKSSVILNVYDAETLILIYSKDYDLECAEFYEVEDELLDMFTEKFNLPNDMCLYSIEFIDDYEKYKKVSVDYIYTFTNKEFKYSNLTVII